MTEGTEPNGEPSELGVRCSCTGGTPRKPAVFTVVPGEWQRGLWLEAMLGQTTWAGCPRLTWAAQLLCLCSVGLRGSVLNPHPVPRPDAGLGEGRCAGKRPAEEQEAWLVLSRVGLGVGCDRCPRAALRAR